MCFIYESTINLRQVNGKKCKEVDGASISSVNVLLEWTGNVPFYTICEITFLVGGP